MRDGGRVADVLRRPEDGSILLEPEDGSRLPTAPIPGIDGDARIAATDLADRLVEGATFVRRGEPLEVGGDGHPTIPFLFDCDGPDEAPGQLAWRAPTALLATDGLDGPGWRLYRRVAPTAETIASDRTHGAAYLSMRALEVLRDRAAVLHREGIPDDDAWRRLSTLADELLEARPTMAVVENRVNRTMWRGAAAGTADAVSEGATATLAEATAAEADAAAAAAAHVEDRGVITLSRSGTVRRALLSGGPSRAVVLESRPAREGVGVAERLAASGIEVALTIDAAAAAAVERYRPDLALVGADAILRDGAVVNKVGTRPLASVVSGTDARFVVVAAADKVTPGVRPTDERGTAADVYRGGAPLDVWLPLFEATPAELVDGIITEDGMIDAERVAEIAATHARRASWRAR